MEHGKVHGRWRDLESGIADDPDGLEFRIFGVDLLFYGTLEIPIGIGLDAEGCNQSMQTSSGHNCGSAECVVCEFAAPI